MKVPKNHLKMWRIAAIALIVPFAFFGAAAQSTDSATVSRLLKQAKVHAALARNDAQFLDANSMSALAWQIDLQRLMRVDEHVKDLARDLGKLQALRTEASPGQTDAIDDFASLMGGIRSQLSQTMWWLYQNQNRFNMPTFRNRAHENLIAVDKVYQHLRQYTGKNSGTLYLAEVAGQ